MQGVIKVVTSQHASRTERTRHIQPAFSCRRRQHLPTDLKFNVQPARMRHSFCAGACCTCSQRILARGTSLPSPPTHASARCMPTPALLIRGSTMRREGAGL